MDITLSPEQSKVFDRVMDWHRGPDRTFVLAGYAGSGKTTLARLIAEAISADGTLFCAFTGKAANVLRDKGCATAGTLHSYLYSLTDHDREVMKQLEADIEAARAEQNFLRMDHLLTLLEEKRLAYRKPKFELNPESPLKYAPLVIVDEYSMLNRKLIDDLEQLATKVLYLGDPFQLPPVEGECPLEPSVFLTGIHRQALESPIIRMATDVREGRRLDYQMTPGMVYQPRKHIAASAYIEADQVIVGRNNTRTAWNNRFRMRQGYDPLDLPHAGEKMICLKNEAMLDLFNGQIGFADTDARNPVGERYTLDFDGIPSLPVFLGDIRGDGSKYDGYNPDHRKLQRFDFSYVITCHKSQGSEFDSVLVYNEPVGSGIMARRWLYTALSRAKNKCVLVEP